MSKKRGTKKRKQRHGGGEGGGQARGMMMGMRGGFKRAVGAGPRKKASGGLRALEVGIIIGLLAATAVLLLRRFGVVHF